MPACGSERLRVPPAAAKGCVYPCTARKFYCQIRSSPRASETVPGYPGTESFSETFGARAMSFFRPALPFLVRISTQFQTIDPKPRKISNQFAEGCVFSQSARLQNTGTRVSGTRVSGTRVTSTWVLVEKFPLVFSSSEMEVHFVSGYPGTCFLLSKTQRRNCACLSQ